MHRLKSFWKRHQQQRDRSHERDAKRTVLEEVFNDMYDSRRRIYKVNFFRGIFFGAGSALGGTVILALIVWVLSLFVNAPLVGDIFKNAQQSIEQTTSEADTENRP